MRYGIKCGWLYLFLFRYNSMNRLLFHRFDYQVHAANIIRLES